MDKKALWEAVKEPLRLLVLAIIPFGIAYAQGYNYEWIAIAVLVLRFIDKWLHEVGKEASTAKVEDWKVRGITRF